MPAVTAQSLFVVVSVKAAFSLGPTNTLLAAGFMLNGTQTAVLAFGHAIFIIVIFGRGVTSLNFSVMAVAFTTWEDSARTRGNLLGARMMTGLAPAANESIMVQAIADLSFVRQRG